MSAIEIIFVIVAYLVGNLNAAYIIVRYLKNEDVRDYGSHNAGTTNVLRVAGKRAAIVVFLLDALKGGLLLVVGRFVLHLDENILAVGVAGVVAGHNWPIFLKFRGGKGTATTIGAFLVFDWQVVLIALALALLILVIWKMVSLASITGITLAPIISILLGRSVSGVVLACVLCLFSLFQHRKNIGRIIQGRESKIGQKVKMKD